MDIDKGEVLRYLGHRGQQLTEELEQMVDEMLELCARLAKPRWTHRRMSLEAAGSPVVLEGGALRLEGADIAAHLAGACEAAVMAVTLGVEVEGRIRRLELADMVRSLVLDAAATALTETACDACQEEIARAAGEDGLVTGARFSPGYGDLPLTVQPDILRVLDTQRKIGLTCTASLILLPRKSVTAVIGLFPRDKRPVKQRGRRSCDSCARRMTCTFRRDGGSCEYTR